MTTSGAASRFSDLQAVTLRMRILNRLAGLAPVRRHRLRNERPLVSVTFDDVPVSAVETGAAILDDHGLHGTFFIATSLLGKEGAFWPVADADAVAGLAGRGHEIGMHTHAHRPVAEMSASALRTDMAAARIVLATITPVQIENFAFPYGFSSPLHRRALSRSVRSSRTAHPGINCGTVDPQFLHSIVLGERRRRPEDLAPLFDDVVARNGWLILTTHDVVEDPSPYGCTPSILVHLCKEAARRGIDIVPVHVALDRIGLPALPLAGTSSRRPSIFS